MTNIFVGALKAFLALFVGAFLLVVGIPLAMFISVGDHLADKRKARKKRQADKCRG